MNDEFIRTIIVVAHKWNNFGFKMIVCYWSHAISSSFGTRYDLLDNAFRQPLLVSGLYVMVKSNLEKDMLQRVWHRFKTRVVMKYLRFLKIVCISLDIKHP